MCRSLLPMDFGATIIQFALVTLITATPAPARPIHWPGGGGTSFATPIMAGIQALVNQRAGGRQGNPNPIYYSLAASEYGASGNSSCNSTLGNAAGSSCIFYDVTQGDMDMPCVSVENCYDAERRESVCSPLPTARISRLTEPHTGWDFATGIGTVNASNLVNNWPGVLPIDDYHRHFQPEPGSSSAEVTFTATVTTTGTTPPTGNVTFNDGATALGTGTLSTVNGAQVATYTTSTLAGGTSLDHCRLWWRREQRSQHIASSDSDHHSPFHHHHPGRKLKHNTFRRVRNVHGNRDRIKSDWNGDVLQRRQLPWHRHAERWSSNPYHYRLGYNRFRFHLRRLCRRREQPGQHFQCAHRNRQCRYLHYQRPARHTNDSQWRRRDHPHHRNPSRYLHQSNYFHRDNNSGIERCTSWLQPAHGNSKRKPDSYNADDYGSDRGSNLGNGTRREWRHAVAFEERQEVVGPECISAVDTHRTCRNSSARSAKEVRLESRESVPVGCGPLCHRANDVRLRQFELEFAKGANVSGADHGNRRSQRKQRGCDHYYDGGVHRSVSRMEGAAGASAPVLQPRWVDRQRNQVRLNLDAVEIGEFCQGR